MAEVSVGTGTATAGGFWTGVGNVLSGIGNAFATVVGGAGQAVMYGGDVAWAGLQAAGTTVGSGLTWIAENPDKAMELGGAAWGIYSGYQQYEAQKLSLIHI